MKKIHLSVSFLILLISFSCSQTSTESSVDQKEPVDVIAIHKNNASLDDRVEEFKVIALESSPEHLIGQVDKVIVGESGIYILDIRTSKALFKFDHAGKFIFKISDVGEDPSQFVMPFDFDIDEDSKRIFIADINQRKIMRFSMLDGKYLDHDKIDFQEEYFAWLKDDIFAFNIDGAEFSNESPLDLLITWDSKKMKKLESFVREYPFTAYFRPRASFMRNDSELFFSKGMHDSLYRWSGNEFQSIAYLDFKDKKIKDEIKAKDWMEAREHIIMNGLYMHNGSFAKSGDHLFFNWMDETEEDPEHLGYYNWSSKEFTNLVSETMPIKTVHGSHKGYFVGMVYGYDLPETSSYYSSSDNINPYVVMFKMK